MTTDETTETAFAWSLTLIAKIMVPWRILVIHGDWGAWVICDIISAYIYITNIIFMYTVNIYIYIFMNSYDICISWLLCLLKTWNSIFLRFIWWAVPYFCNFGWVMDELDKTRVLLVMDLSLGLWISYRVAELSTGFDFLQQKLSPDFRWFSPALEATLG